MEPKKFNPYYNANYVTYRGKGSRENTGAFCPSQKTGFYLRGLERARTPIVGKMAIKEKGKRYIYRCRRAAESSLKIFGNGIKES